MSEFEAYECEVCNEEFSAYPDSNAAQKGYCSPSCAIEGKDIQ